MAQEIELESAQELKPVDVLEFLAQQCDSELVGRWSGDPFVRTPGMEIRAYRVAPRGRELKEEAQRHAAKISFRPKMSVTFGIRKLASLPERDAAWEMMLRLVIAFAQRYPARPRPRRSDATEPDVWGEACSIAQSRSDPRNQALPEGGGDEDQAARHDPYQRPTKMGRHHPAPSIYKIDDQ